MNKNTDCREDSKDIWKFPMKKNDCKITTHNPPIITPFGTITATVHLNENEPTKF